jgi:hypothetical protein
MKPKTAIPRFQFHLSHRHHYNGLITVGDEVIHCIKDVHNFYNSLGYTDEIRDSGQCFDEFIWFEYSKDHSYKPKACLQAKIINYLIQYSSMFMKKYADVYEGWLGSCEVEMQNFNDCTQCIMHPNQRESDYFNCTTSNVSFYATNTI